MDGIDQDELAARIAQAGDEGSTILDLSRQGSNICPRDRHPDRTDLSGPMEQSIDSAAAGDKGTDSKGVGLCII